MLLCPRAVTAALATASAASTLILPVAAASSKRGLVFTPNVTAPADDKIWIEEPTTLTWYYNYGPNPESVYQDVPQSEFEFVPMMWGAPDSLDDTSFLSTVKSLIKSKGINITNVLSFNEPDGSFEYGGSQIEPSTAAQLWVNNMIPLQEMGVRVGLPACTGGSSGLPWLQNFLAECSELISSKDKQRNCTFDFVTIHWYGNFEGLASHMGEYSAAFPNKTMWITEFNLNDRDLEATQSFYNMSTEYFDRLDFVERYSYFGAFRSNVSNIGPNGAMLSDNGSLTDIGAWYLGRQPTGILPTSSSSLHLPLPQKVVAVFAAVVAAAISLA
ncbi:glycoside hydrolase, catalytic core [Thermothelomyces thermophilus ATCC 42464]|uniref:Glycoside hydrolase, catalytic core n=1 Tax=Thermothelomyces thermophilus (strain ATCC 42464 / BCRC 31852 / DSM 1799) TaxID=573729 RepID=G2QDY9_THET4|nr:glycoside hydrolase, catalytic core [Thermothelomyces thermophilus ATCC 42464]AEO58398.1 glycoside hydrolase, catalytic core [Thermothelomyces thermophilus ATCC 42464]